MESTTSADAVGVDRTEGENSGGQIGKLVDWLVAVFLGIWGIASLLGGWALFLLADRTRIAGWVADGRITSTELSDPQLIDATYAFAWWGGLGIIVTGALLLLAAVVYLTVRSRTRKGFAETGVAPLGLWTSAVLGAVVTFVTSFVPFSPIIGGGVAGYVHRGTRVTGAKAGASAGLVATVPLVIVFAFLMVGLATVGGAWSGFVAAAFLFSLLVFETTFALLGAVGGYLGIALGESREPIA